MYQIEIKINFRSGHRLIEPYKGKCNNPHGEGYTAMIFFEKETLDNCGMVFDFGDIKRKIKEWINEKWDHAYIHNTNDEVGKYLCKKGFKTFDLGNQNPTAENMAYWLYKLIKAMKYPIVKVGIIESFEDSIAWYKK